jgi:hypothetical protein
LQKRIKEAEQFDLKRKAFLNSEKGVEAFRVEVKRLYELLRNKKEFIEKELDGFRIAYEEKDNNCFVHSYNYSLRFYWDYSIKNSLDYSGLNLIFQSPNRYPDPPTKIDEYSFNFDIIAPDQKVWTFASDRSKYLTSEELVNFSFNILFKRIEKENKNKRLSKYL